MGFKMLERMEDCIDLWIADTVARIESSSTIIEPVGDICEIEPISEKEIEAIFA